jgi:glutamine cyclotransferase
MLLRPAKNLLWVAALLAACDQPPPSIEYEVLTSFPHDPSAYTQGLLFHDGFLYESTGRYGESSVRRVNAETGEVVAATALDPEYFGEGLARVGSELVQLTWKSGIALVYELETLELLRTHSYTGEGWGLCFDGTHLYMTDGSSTLFQRDPVTFEVTAELTVRAQGFPLHQLNELECVGEAVYANVYQTDRIVEIDIQSGEVVAELNGFDLSIAGGRPIDPAAVLNGIAYIPETDVFLVTGKLWSRVLALRFSP